MRTRLTRKIVSILEANSLIQEVFDYEAEQFNGDPSATVTPSENANDYNTNQENVRVYAFNVRLFMNRTKSSKVEAERKLRTLEDSVLDDLDKNYMLTGLETKTGYTFINMFAVPSVWGYSLREDEYRAVEIIVKCRVSVDLSAIS